MGALFKQKAGQIMTANVLGGKAASKRRVSFSSISNHIRYLICQGKMGALFKQKAGQIMTANVLGGKAASKRRVSFSSMLRRQSQSKGKLGDGGGGEEDKTFRFEVAPNTMGTMMNFLFNKGIEVLDNIPSIQLLMLPHLFEAGQGNLDKGFSKETPWV
jgi:hypothetical protein